LPTSEQALANAARLYTKLVGRRDDVDKTQRYYRGDQPLVFATDEWKTLHAQRYQGFSDNWCGVVGSAPGERTEIRGFRLGDDMDLVSPNEKQLWDDWERADGPAQSSQGFLTSTVSKRSFALVWGSSDGEPQLTWEHPGEMLLECDPERPRDRLRAIKSWISDGVEYLTLYEPDFVWKWERKSTEGDSTKTSHTTYGSPDNKHWATRQGPGDDTWPVRNPLGEVPVIEFPNRPTLGGEPLSDITGTMAMQDAINMLWAYLFVAADYASMPARVVMGQEPPKIPILNADGEKVGDRAVDIQELTKGRMLWLTGQNAKIDKWDASSLDVFTDVVNVAVRHIAAQTRTPIYLIHGELGNVNGETLTGLDAPLVSKVRETHKFYTTPVRDMFGLMAKVRDNGNVAQAAKLAVIKWVNPEVRSDAQIADAALKDRQVGIPMRSVLENRYGYSQNEVERIMRLWEIEQQDPYLATVANKVMNSGTPNAS